MYGYVNIELGQEITQGEKVLLETPLEYDFVTKGIVSMHQDLSKL